MSVDFIGELMFISHNAAQLYTVEFGTGPRTILAHGGWTGSWELWTEPFRLLSRSWHTVAYDHRGTGATIAPVETISVENMVDDLFAVMDEMRIETCILAAESAGAVTAMTALFRQPRRFEGLVLVDALLHREENSSDLAVLDGLRRNFEVTVGKFVDACVLESEPDSQAMRSWGRKILGRASPEAAIRLIQCTYGIDLCPRLPEIPIPTLILHGDSDVIVAVKESQEMAARIPQSCLHILENTGHVPTMTRPNEVAQEINQYFYFREVKS